MRHRIPCLAVFLFVTSAGAQWAGSMYVDPNG